MSTNHKELPDFDGWLFSVNRNNIPAADMAKYAGKYVAYSLDGTRILASGDDMDEVERNLISAGIEPSKVVGSYVCSAEETTPL
jgi:Family of unknown function (DUF5678)